MKIIRFADTYGAIHFGRPVNASLSEAELLDGSLFEALHPTGDTVDVGHILPPIDPPNVFCIGLNYKQHAEETHMEIPQRPVLFLKTTTTVAAHETPVTLPSLSYQVDWEGELAVVIGKSALNVPEPEALEYVLGYTCANDISARDWQMHLDSQWCRGKSFDRFGPLGPILVTTDEIHDPGNLRIRTRLNGRTVQDSNTCDMIFSVGHLVAYLSQGTTLLPGTVILTGTPPGVGMGQNPPRFLRPDDTVEVEIEKIGTLRSRFVAG